MRDSTPPRSHSPELPSGRAQALARHHAIQQHPIMPMLLASALLWGTVWGLYTMLPQRQPVAGAKPVVLQPLTVKTFGQQPALSIALADLPQPVQPSRKAQRVRSDLFALFGHVASSLVRDELETMVLRLSLGQQVAVHLRQDLLD